MDIADLSTYNAESYSNEIATFNSVLGSEMELLFWRIER